MSKQYTLLYAEDESNVRKSYIRYLEENYNLLTYEANDGIEALELYKKHRPEILITDITMPNMDGLTLIKKIREYSYDTKVIVLTAHSEQEMMILALDMYVVNYLIKPINRKRLRDVVDIAIKTLLPIEKISNSFIRLSSDIKWCTANSELYINDEEVKLTHAESALIDILCKNKNNKIDSATIFLHIWDDPDKEFSADAIRTLVKKVRQQLPENILENIYGGYYRLNIH